MIIRRRKKLRYGIDFHNEGFYWKNWVNLDGPYELNAVLEYCWSL